MTKKIIIPFLFSIALLPGIKSISQQTGKEKKTGQYRAIHWTVQDGLNVDGGHTMIKDANGFLWIGSNLGGFGFCRFDGAKFKKYFPDPNSHKTINSDKIISFTEDCLHNIWIGTDIGLSRYDFKADTFTNFESHIDPGSSTKSILPFWATSDKVYCVESGQHIVAYDIHSFNKEKLLSVKEEKIQLRYIVLDTTTSSLWMIDYNDSVGSGLLHIDIKNSKHQYYTWPCYRNIPGHGHGSEAMQYDRKRNSIWINSPDGLIEFSLKDKQFHLPDAFGDLIKSKDYERFVGVDLDKYGRLWLATKPRGILIYDPETEQVQQLFSDQDPQKKAAASNLKLYCDRDGIVWTSNWESFGLYEILPFDLSVKRYAAKPGMQDSLSDGFVISIIPAAQNKIWIGTNDGINIFDPVTEKFEVLREKDLPGIRGKAIAPVYIDTFHQKAWLQTGSPDDNMFYFQQGRMYLMDIKTRQCTQIIFRDGAKQIDTLTPDPTSAKPYKNGFLVFAEFYGLFEIKEGSLFADLVVPLNIKDFTTSVSIEDERRIYIKLYGALPNFTFENKDGKWIKIPHLLDNQDWWFMIHNKKDQTHWASFKNKLVHFEKDFSEIKTYTEEDGYSGLAYKIILDNTGNLWFTNILEQVGRLNVATGIITMLSETDGYHKKNYDWAVPLAKDPGDNIYVGTGLSKGNEGLDRIYPEKYFSRQTSSVYLQSITINQKPFPLSIGVNNLEELSLRYNQNTISIEAGIIDFYTRGKDNLRYKLVRDGKDEEWQYGTAYYNTIRYDGLVPGNYKLVMQASNAGSEFNSPEKILTINISPPFWQTWWFRVLAAVFVIAIIYSIIQYRSRSLRQRNAQLEEKVMLRTKELKHSLEELRETQAQLIQSEKMASLGELTAGIAHEIQNPLNFVNNFSEVSLELMQEMKEEIEKGNTDEVKYIATDIEHNLEKINHHGKRADAIVKGMLQHSRSSSGIKEPTDINKLADEYLRLAFHGLRAKDKLFNTTMKTDFDESLAADEAGIGKTNIIPQDIGRVLLNLYNNAFYAVSEKQKAESNNLPTGQASYEPTVSVSTKKIGDKVEITVKDNGNGIPQKIVDKIFQPFFTTKPTGQGTGLGLSLAYDIIKAHGGEITVNSKEGEGSEFIIKLPAA